MLSNIYAKAKQYTLHFFVSLVIIIGLAGIATHLEQVRQLNEQIYLISHAQGKLVVSSPPKKSIVDRIIDKKTIPPAPVPTDTIHSVVEVVQKSTACPPIVVTLLKDGTVVSNSPGVKTILVEDYTQSFFGNELMFRGAGLIYPGDKFHGNKIQGDWGVQVSYVRVWRIYPDVTFARHTIGLGISYHQDIWTFKNVYFGGGYGYHFEDGYWGPYGSISVRL